MPGGGGTMPGGRPKRPVGGDRLVGMPGGMGKGRPLEEPGIMTGGAPAMAVVMPPTKGPRFIALPLPWPSIVAADTRDLASNTGGGPASTEKDTRFSPRRIIRPTLRFIVSLDDWLPAFPWPLSAPSTRAFFRRLACRRLVRNSSQSASTRFMCLSKPSSCPTNTRPSCSVVFRRWLSSCVIFWF